MRHDGKSQKKKNTRTGTDKMLGILYFWSFCQRNPTKRRLKERPVFAFGRLK